MTVSDLIKNVRMLNSSEFKVFLKQIRDLEKEIAEKDLSKKEIELLKQINKPFNRTR